MTPEKQRIAIAEACGWTITVHPTESYPHMLGEHENCSCAVPIPYYTTDLNAMHEAEKILTDDQFEKYEVWLANVAGNCDSFGSLRRQRAKVCATTAQRAEAFLRTLNKWEDQ